MLSVGLTVTLTSAHTRVTYADKVRLQISLQLLVADLCFCEAEVEAFAQVLYASCAGLECRTATPLHHFHQQEHSISMLAACQETLYAKNLHIPQHMSYA